MFESVDNTTTIVFIILHDVLYFLIDGNQNVVTWLAFSLDSQIN